MIDELGKGIWRIRVPFEDIYTAVFVFEHDGHLLVFDTASNSSDVCNYIFPFLDKLTLPVDYILISHTHGDHAGGLAEMMKRFPNARVGLFSENVKGADVLSCGDMIFNRFRVIKLAGHSSDCLALFDAETKILFSGDCLQFCGVGRYGAYAEDGAKYFKSLNAVRKLNPDKIIPSHNYLTFGDVIEKCDIEAALEECRLAYAAVSELPAESKRLSGAETAELIKSNQYYNL